MPAKNEITLYNDLMIKFNQVAADHLASLGHKEEAHHIQRKLDAIITDTQTLPIDGFKIVPNSISNQSNCSKL